MAHKVTAGVGYFQECNESSIDNDTWLSPPLLRKTQCTRTACEKCGVQ